MRHKTVWMALALCSGLLVGCVTGSEPDDIIRIYECKILQDDDMPFLSNWSAIVTDSDETKACLSSLGGNSRGVLLAVDGGVNPLSFHSIEQWFVYSSSYPPRQAGIPKYGEHLMVVPHFGAIPLRIFSVPEDHSIRSISVSPKFNRIAFLSEKGYRTTKRRLYVGGLNKSRDALAYLRDCGAIDIAFWRDQLFWDEWGESVFWAGKDGRIVEHHVGTGKSQYHEVKIARLLGVKEDAFLAVRTRWPVDDDHELIWTLVSISRKTGQEKVISVFRCDNVRNSVEIPGTPIVALNVVMQCYFPATEDWDWASILFDTSKGVLLGRTEFLIKGFVKKRTDRNKKSP